MTNDPDQIGHHWWPSLLFAGCAAAFALVAFGLQPPGSPRYWWYAAVGEFITTWEAIPDEQLFLHLVETDEPWMYSSWLGAVAFAVIDEAGGLGLATLIRNLTSALAVGALAWVLARKFDRLTAIVVPTVLFALVLTVAVPVVPWSLTVPFTTLAVLAGFGACTRPELWWRPAMLGLVVLTVVNLEAATAPAVALVGLIVGGVIATDPTELAGRRRRVVAALLAVASVPALLGFAYGPGYWTEVPAALFSIPESIVSTTVVVPVVTAAAGLASVVALDEPAAPMPRPALAAMIVATGVYTVFAPPALPIAAAVVALTLGHWLQDRPGRKTTLPGPLVLGGALVVTTILAVVVQPGVETRTPLVSTIYDDVRTDPPHPGVMSEQLPLRCAEQLRDARADLRLFHSPEKAGLLLYHLLDPERPRAMLFDDHRRLLDDEIRDEMLRLAQQGAIRGPLAYRSINAAVLDRRRFADAVETLEQSPDWYDLRPGENEPYGCFIDIDPDAARR